MTTQPARCPACGSTEWVVTFTGYLVGTLEDGTFRPNGDAAKPPDFGQPVCARCGREYPHRLKTEQFGR